MGLKKTTLHVCLITGLAMALAVAGPSLGQNSGTTSEAPSGYDNQPNGLTDQPTFSMDRGKFEEVEAIGDGLGPIYNAQSCRECHQNPVSGSTSQVKELRAGHQDSFGNFVAATAFLADNAVTLPNRSLINQRAICPAVDTIAVNGQTQTFKFPQTQGQERITTGETILAFRISLNTLGDGFVESISDQTLLNLASSQCNNTGGLICGETVRVPVLEASGALAVGRFGWKNQHASLLSFSSDAYLNEMGISNRLPPNKVDVTRVCDVVPDPNDNTPDSEGLNDIDHFARFMRATKVPPRDAALANSSDGITGQICFTPSAATSATFRPSPPRPQALPWTPVPSSSRLLSATKPFILIAISSSMMSARATALSRTDRRIPPTRCARRLFGEFARARSYFMTADPRRFSTRSSVTAARHNP